MAQVELLNVPRSLVQGERDDGTWDDLTWGVLSERRIVVAELTAGLDRRLTEATEAGNPLAVLIGPFDDEAAAPAHFERVRVIEAERFGTRVEDAPDDQRIGLVRFHLAVPSRHVGIVAGTLAHPEGEGIGPLADLAGAMARAETYSGSAIRVAETVGDPPDEDWARAASNHVRVASAFTAPPIRPIDPLTGDGELGFWGPCWLFRSC